ncbi:C4-dicarboxylate TRAP transporter substrate-binding protein [Pseudogemmobacter faecipullorum]|uniref:C4-dicarboxylate TRAP transporter substrate-binding protein n=1 Tax=Pseudogemmobacter faecipullorum TaxID=2755041 RepID=A0ABS8CJ40_9RHOB|nr:C4-dicarboxylate TRAP transporter substrate-binding protein [Pseudogemmobacter faecipullorum]MCB5409390.1 C4-dicarboxylate TRAP transporter substrate-binding protein [Pseudogemmobacter faecipullorum]
MKKLLIASVLGGLMSSAALADSYIFTSYLNPTNPLHAAGVEATVQKINREAAGAFSIELFSSGSLVPATTTLQGLGDEVAQFGLVVPAYTASELPLTNTINDLVFASGDALVSALAWTELGLTNARLAEEWNKRGTIFLGGYSTPLYQLICGPVVKSLADVKGKKIRTVGAAQTAWIASLGGVPVSVPSPDIYTGLERGSLDCTMSDATALDKGNRLWEIAKGVTTVEAGVIIGATFVANQRFWSELPPAERRLMLDNFAEGIARTQAQYAMESAAALQGSQERGLDVGPAAEDLAQSLKEFQSAHSASLAASAMKERGIADPSDVIADYFRLEEKWREIFAGVDREDLTAVTRAVRENLYDGLDENSFGL